MKKPNILFLFTDDQRFDTIQAVNNPQIQTPVLNRLVEEGTVFNEAYIMGGTCDAVCMPSRAMLNTGRNLFQLQGSGQEIPDQHVLMGEHFQRNGYDTYGIGKWHNGTASFNRSFQDGAEIFFGGMEDHWNVPANRYHPNGDYEVGTTFFDNGVIPPFKREIQYDHISEGKHSTDLFAGAAINYLEKRVGAEDPFYLYVSFMAPHDPRTMPDKYRDMYDPADIELPVNFLTEHPFDNGELDVRDENLAAKPRSPEEINRHIAEYYAMISHLDAEIGRILDALKASGEYENTIIILAGDNGLALGQHGLMGKQNLYDHSLHVPLIMAGPEIPAGGSNNAFVYLFDIFPTLCEKVGIELPTSVTGRSFVDVLKGKHSTARDSLLFAYRDIMRAIQTDEYKLIRYLAGPEERAQLFNRREDPKEINNVVDSVDPSLLKTLYDELEKISKAAGDPMLMQKVR